MQSTTLDNRTPPIFNMPRGLVDELPTAIVDATREPYGARALIFALLIDRQTETQEVQIAHLSRAADPGVCKETLKLLPLIEQLDARVRLPLVDIALPALCALTDAQYRQFKQNITELVEADRTIALFEWSLQRILLHDLDAQRFNVTPGRVRHHRLHRLQPHYELLLSTLAHTGSPGRGLRLMKHSSRPNNMWTCRRHGSDGTKSAGLTRLTPL